ncbi:MAG: Na+/H+ antiporter subunit E [Hyphomicrobiales bacterium]
MRTLSLGCALFVFWLLLSGHYTALLLTIGTLCCVGIVALALRMSVVDDEGHPIHLALGALTYWPWLLFEIAKSSWGVTRLILDPRLPISPTLVKVRAGQKTRIGVNIYANSITLTPGTISVEVEGNDILVHAITEGGAEELSEGQMDRRVSAFEGNA